MASFIKLAKQLIMEEPEVRKEQRKAKRIEKLQKAVELEERKEQERYEQCVRQRTNVTHGFASHRFIPANCSYK